MLVVLWYWIKSKKFTLELAKVIGLLTTVWIGAQLTRALLSSSGVVIFNKTFDYKTKILPYNNLWASISTAFRQLMNLENANIFGRTVDAHNLDIFINFGILLVSTVGLILLLRGANYYKNKKNLTTPNDYTLRVIAVSYFMVFLVYILSGQVVQRLNNNQTVSLGQSRYIAFMPLLAIVGSVWILKRYFDNHKRLHYFLLSILLINMLVAYPSVINAYKSDLQSMQPSRKSLANVIQILKKDGVSEVVTGYWYGSSLRFWSHNTIKFAPEIGCNEPFNYNYRTSWLTPQKNIRSALIVDHNGPDASFWPCTNNQLINIYGRPAKQQTAVGSTSGTYISIWVYNYDVRQKLLPIN